MHPAKCIQALWGAEIWLQEQHKSPGSLIRSLAAAACACSDRSPAPCGTVGAASRPVPAHACDGGGQHWDPAH